VATTTPPAPAASSPSTTTSEAQADAGAFHLPAPGRYRYHFDRQGADPVAFDGADLVTAGGQGFSERRDRQSVKESHTYELSGGALRETMYSFDSATTQSPCHWSRAIVVVPAHPQAGDQWTSSAKCTTSVGQAVLALDYKATSKVVGVHRAKTPAGAVSLLRIDRVVVLTTTVKGKSAVRHSTLVQYYDTARCLLAQSTEDAVDHTPTGTTTYRIVESMLTLQPEVSR